MGNDVRLTLSVDAYPHGTFTTGLYVMGGSSSDPLELECDLSTLGVRDVLIAFPILWWSLPAGDSMSRSISEAVAQAQAHALGAIEVSDSSLPLAPSSTQTVTFTVADDTLTLSSTRHVGLIGGLGFKVVKRLAWFLERCQTVAVIINAPSKTWVATVTRDATPPLVLAHPGSFDSTSLDGLIDHSIRWKAVSIGNSSLLAGAEDFPDHHYRTYEATPDSNDIPSGLSYSGGCIACGGDGNSREHCVPNWIASDHKVVPVTAKLFCLECNNHFGDKLEKEIAVLTRTGKLPCALRSKVFALWAIKTAVALSVASDVRIDPAWMRAVRVDELPDGFRVFATTDVNMYPGYAFSVGQFSRSATNEGTFLFSFVVDKLLFVVMRDPSGSFDPPELSQVFPTSAPGKIPPQGFDLSGLQRSMMERLTGHAMGHSDSRPKAVRSKRV